VDHQNGIYLDSLHSTFKASSTQLAKIRFHASHMRMRAYLIRRYCGFEELTEDKKNQDKGALIYVIELV
jgi:hypothetical protein